MTAPLNIAGKRFGRLVVLERASGRNGKSMWLVECDCGTRRTLSGNRLTAGTKSCGCLQREVAGARFASHGLSKTPEYSIWLGMIGRCTRPKASAYPYYGGRGICVCDLWRHNFPAFLAHVGPRPTPQHSIDRIDTNGHYEPGNVRWATMDEQRNNRTDNNYVIYRGARMTITKAAKLAGSIVSPKRAASRIAKFGWTVDRAVETAARYRHG